MKKLITVRKLDLSDNGLEELPTEEAYWQNMKEL